MREEKKGRKIEKERRERKLVNYRRPDTNLIFLDQGTPPPNLRDINKAPQFLVIYTGGLNEMSPIRSYRRMFSHQGVALFEMNIQGLGAVA